MRTSLDTAADPTLAYRALDLIDLALVVWNRDRGRVVLANDRGARLLRAAGGTVDDPPAPLGGMLTACDDAPAHGEIVLDGARFALTATRIQDGSGDALVLFTASPAPSSDDFAGRYGLSPRERDIVERVCRGLSNDEIARATRLTVGTVKQYLNRIFAAVGVHSRAQLIVAAIAHGRQQSGEPIPTRA
jgi:DNA-binding CsgD family transcriptional regulator